MKAELDIFYLQITNNITLDRSISDMQKIRFHPVPYLDLKREKVLLKRSMNVRFLFTNSKI